MSASDAPTSTSGRPRGVLRQALAAWARQHAAAGAPGGLTAAELVEHVPGMVRLTVTNMAQAGELVRVGWRQGPGQRLSAVYGPAPRATEGDDRGAFAMLDDLFASWGYESTFINDSSAK